jgi:hypothetical protein
LQQQNIEITSIIAIIMALPVFAWMTTSGNHHKDSRRPGLAVKQRAFGATASFHGLMEGRGHRWRAGLPTNEGLQHE